MHHLLNKPGSAILGTNEIINMNTNADTEVSWQLAEGGHPDDPDYYRSRRRARALM